MDKSDLCELLEEAKQMFTPEQLATLKKRALPKHKILSTSTPNDCGKEHSRLQSMAQEIFDDPRLHKLEEVRRNKQQLSQNFQSELITKNMLASFAIYPDGTFNFDQDPVQLVQSDNLNIYDKEGIRIEQKKGNEINFMKEMEF